MFDLEVLLHIVDLRLAFIPSHNHYTTKKFSTNGVKEVLSLILLVI